MTTNRNTQAGTEPDAMTEGTDAWWETEPAQDDDMEGWRRGYHKYKAALAEAKQELGDARALAERLVALLEMARNELLSQHDPLDCLEVAEAIDHELNRGFATEPEETP